jgi:hypothetical protein
MILDRAKMAADARADPPVRLRAAPAADAALGVFETMLVRDGPGSAPGAPHRTAGRQRSRAVPSRARAADTGARVASAAAGHALARLRIEVVPRPGEPPAVGFDTSALADADVGCAGEATLATVGVAGGNGAHKLIDRSWLRQIEAHVGAGARALLVSRSGALLETTRANVLLLRDGALATPPLDGSILPGVVRGAVLAHAERLGIAAHELPLTLERLRDADMVLLSGSLRLLERARAPWEASQRGGRGAPERGARHRYGVAMSGHPRRRGLILSHGDEAPAALLEEWLSEHGCEYVVHDVTQKAAAVARGLQLRRLAGLGAVGHQGRSALGRGGDRAAARRDRGRDPGARGVLRRAGAVDRAGRRGDAGGQSRRSAGSSWPSASTRCRPARGFTGTTSS